MKTYSYLEAKKNLSSLLNSSINQDVIIRKPNGQQFRIVPVRANANYSPFEIDGIDTIITTDEILAVVKESREKEY